MCIRDSVLPDLSTLFLQTVQQIVFQHGKLELGLTLKDVKHLNRTEHLLLLIASDLVLTELVQSFDKVLAVFEGWQVPEVSERLHPEVSGHRGVVIGRLLVLDTNLQHHVLVILLYVVVEKLLLHVEQVAALFNTV